jgi:hypothetical protein
MAEAASFAVSGADTPSSGGASRHQLLAAARTASAPVLQLERVGNQRLEEDCLHYLL